MDWISVKDKLPPDCSAYEHRSMYLINNAGFTTIGYWYPKTKIWSDGQYNITRAVTHWMPLPKPSSSQPAHEDGQAKK